TRRSSDLQCRYVIRMCVYDVVVVGTGAVDPAVEADRGVGHSLSSDYVEIFINSDEVVFSDLVKPQPELLGVIGPRFLGSRRDLASETRVVTCVKKNAARQCELLPG